MGIPDKKIQQGFSQRGDLMQKFGEKLNRGKNCTFWVATRQGSKMGCQMGLDMQKLKKDFKVYKQCIDLTICYPQLLEEDMTYSTCITFGQRKHVFGSLASAETVGQAASHTELHGAPVFSLMAGGRLCVVEVWLLSMLGLEVS